MGVRPTRLQPWVLMLATAGGWACMSIASGQTPPYGTTTFPYLCNLNAGDWPGECCASQSCGSGAPAATDRRNIVLIVSDDQGYCQYGFMAGLCSNDATKDCWGEGDCGATGRCISSVGTGLCSNASATPCTSSAQCAGGGTCDFQHPDRKLRLADPACRNRQPRSVTANCQGTAIGSQRVSLRFNRGEAPCPGTTVGTRPTLRTPHLDRLARDGVVFPRAYLGGQECKTSRRVMMHGRYNRHMQDFWTGSTGFLECQRANAGVAPLGCILKSSSSTQCDGRACEDAHTLAWWLQHGANGPTATYRGFAFGKTENMTPGTGGFDVAFSNTGKGVGSIRCQGDPTCSSDLQSGYYSLQRIPLPQFFDEPQKSLRPLVDAIHATIEPRPTGGYVQSTPFFLWFGPHLPHEGLAPEAVWSPAYSTDSPPLERQHWQRVTWFDAVLGGLTYHLRRACTCSPAGTPRSLYDNTVILFLTDNGFLQAGAKFDTSENTHRTPLIVSAPEYRSGAVTPPTRVLDRELAHAVDLLPTILAYAGMTYWAENTPEEEYAIGRNLKPLIEAPASARRRHLVFGEKARKRGGNTGESRGQPRYVTTRPGRLGVCQTALSGAGHAHVHPCLSTTDCPAAAGDCVCPPASEGSACTGLADPKWKRCANRPNLRCEADADCGQDLCGTASPRTCQRDLGKGSFKDFEGRSCATGGDCVPPGVCRPLILRVETKTATDGTAATGVAGVYDLDWQPDHRGGHNLRTLVPGYLPSTVSDQLGSKLWACVQDFAALDPIKRKWIGNQECVPELEVLKP